jgi:hypothetical protein
LWQRASDWVAPAKLLQERVFCFPSQGRFPFNNLLSLPADSFNSKLNLLIAKTKPITTSYVLPCCVKAKCIEIQASAATTRLGKSFRPRPQDAQDTSSSPRRCFVLKLSGMSPCVFAIFVNKSARHVKHTHGGFLFWLAPFTAAKGTTDGGASKKVAGNKSSM